MTALVVFLKQIYKKGWTAMYSAVLAWIIIGYVFIIIMVISTIIIIKVADHLKEEYNKIMYNLKVQMDTPSFGTFIEKTMNDIKKNQVPNPNARTTTSAPDFSGLFTNAQLLVRQASNSFMEQAHNAINNTQNANLPEISEITPLQFRAPTTQKQPENKEENKNNMPPI